MIDDFNFLPRVESGGLGIVHKVQHKQFGYYRAIKQIRAQGNDPHARKNFEEECKKLMKLSNGQHPNIVHTHGFQEEDGKVYLEMDWIDGKTLEDYCVKGRFVPMDEVLRFVENIASALAYCHKEGIVHNDLHSRNIMRRDSDGAYILLDFGLAMENGEVVRTSRLDMGCPEYMSPERAKIELLDLPSLKSANANDLPTEMFNELRKATPQWDIYSFGCLIFKALTGEAPFYRKNNSDDEYKKVLKQHVEVEPDCRTRINEMRRIAFEKAKPDTEFSNEECPDWFIDMVAKCLSKEAGNRYKDAKEFLDKFQKYLKNDDWNLEEENQKLNARIIELELKISGKNEELTRLRESGIKKPVRVNLWFKWFSALVVCVALFSNVIAIYHKVIHHERIIAIAILSSIVVISICCYETICHIKERNN